MKAGYKNSGKRVKIEYTENYMERGAMTSKAQTIIKHKGNYTVYRDAQEDRRSSL